MSNIYDSIKYFKASDNVEIEYADLGGEGPILLFIPGYSLATDLVLPALAKYREQFRIVTLTLRGFGGSNPKKARGSEEKGEISLMQAAKDVRELICHLNISNCIMVGYSMGSFVAFSYVNQFGCQDLSRLVILDMTPKLINDESWNLGLYQGHYTKENALRDLEIMENDYIKGFNEYFFHQAAFTHNRNEVRDYVFTEKMKKDIDEYAKWYNIPGLTGDALMYVNPKKWHLYRTYWEEMCSQDFRPTLKNIAVPTGIFCATPGSIYDIHTANYLISKIDNSKIYPIQNATHTTLITSKVDDLFKQLLAFVEDFK